jgi:hypothetical protein
MRTFHEHEQLLAVILGIGLWGCLGGICSAAVIFFLQGIWAPVLNYNLALSPVFQFQIIVSFATLSLIVGAIAADLFRTSRNCWRDSVITGLLSGICTGLVFTVIIVSNDMVSHPSIVQYANDPFQMRTFLDRLFQQWLIPLAGFILVSGILHALGAWYHGSHRGFGLEIVAIPQTPAIFRRLFKFRFLFLTLLTIILIPPGLAYLGMVSGIYEKQNTCCPLFDSVEVSRTNADSLQIILKTNLKISPPATGAVRTVKITIDEKDVSTQAIIMNSRLNDSIDPPEGLLYRDYASVVLRGDDIMGNDTFPVHLNVIATYPDLGYDAVICDMKT